MKTAFVEKQYKELADGEHFWSNQEDSGDPQIEKTKTGGYWMWADEEGCVLFRYDPDRPVWVAVQYKEWPEYLIPMSCAAIVLLTIAFFCYAIWKG